RDRELRLRELEGMLLLRGGRPSDAAALLRVVAPRFEDAGFESDAAVVRSVLALAEARAGGVPPERTAAIAAEAEAARGVAYEAAARSLTALAEALAAGGEPGALAAAREAVAVAESGDWLLVQADAHLALARALAAAGDPAAAAEAEEAG